MKGTWLATTTLVTATLTLGAAPSPSIFPDSVPGRRAQAYFEAFNAGEAAMRGFIAANVAPGALVERPLERRLAVYREMRDEHGTLTPLRLVEAANDHVQVIARTGSDGRLEFTFMLEPEPPHHLLGLRVMDTGPGAEGGAAPAAERLDEAAAVAAWRAHLDSLTRAGSFSGAALLARGDQVLLRAAFGEASRAGRVENRADTKFNLGSINKIFTKLAIGQLVEQGKLRLDDTISRWLPDYPAAVAGRVTVAHLLGHRGGIGDIFGAAYDRCDRSKLRRNADWIPLFRDLPPAFEPGTRQEYSNGGYVLLGAILEKASGEDYFDYVRRHIYEPLGMKDTDHFASGETSVATGYTRERFPGLRPDATGWADNAPTRPYRGSAAGGGYSTLDDLFRFVQAMRAAKLLGPATQSPEFREFRANENGELGLGISGGAPGINAAIETHGPYTIIVLANLDPPAAGAPARWLGQRLTQDGARMEMRRVGPGGGGSRR